MDPFWKKIVCIFTVTALLTGSAVAQQAETKQEVPAETVSAEQRPLVIYETLSGIVQSSDTREVKTDFEEWKSLEVAFVLPEGTVVKKGDRLLEFDITELDRAIESARLEVQQQEMDVQSRELAAKQAQITYEIDSAANERDMQAAREDYEYYETVLRPDRLDDLEYSLRSSEYSVEYAREELDQLLKMYNEDELTEESEQIVLKRAQRSLESAERRLKQTRRNMERQRRIEIPRDDLRRKDELRKKSLAYEKKKLELEEALRQAELALAKAEMERAKTQEKLERLEQDRQKMVAFAEIDGVLMYGGCKRGKWTPATGSAAQELEAGTKLPVNRVVLTVVNPNRNVIRTEIPEAKLARFRPGTEGTAVLKANQDIRLRVTLKATGAVPLAGAKFDAMFQFDDESLPGEVRPPLNCDIVCKVHHNEAAVLVPRASVFSDDGVHHFVYLPDGERRGVEIGFEKDGQVEIRSGLEAGDEILKEAPQDDQAFTGHGGAMPVWG